MAARKPRFERHAPEVRRQRLIEAAIECLKRYGHEGLSVRRISAEAGVSIGLINHHFPTKDALVAEAYRHFNAELNKAVRVSVERAGSPREQLRALFRAVFAPPNLDRDTLTVWIVLWGLYHHSPEIRKVHEEAYGGYVELLRELLTQLQKDCGKFRLSVRLAAIGAQALLDGLWLEWCLDPENFSPKEAVALCESWIDSLATNSPRHA
ncbi:MAG TPA: TetR family transcriptional regulator C-terminal domain-containing protein [Steroidobacteraceae bacterium]|jgi:AcrR family transcriptional regulator|nr:TetR family transcriptional regulator C-terminal domain-containing protein [Steroidobacteraceae bacterium]